MAEGGGALMTAFLGAVLLLHGSVVVEDNHGYGSSTWFTGGGIWHGQSGSSFLSHGVTFRANSAMLGGGFYDDGIQPLDGTIKMENISMIDNTARASGGGAFFFGRSIEISRVSFRNNVCSGQGGGVSFEAGSAVKVRSSTFINNKGAKGGALFANGKHTVLDVHSTTFRSNAATEEGGGIYLLGAAKATLFKTSFSSCTADQNGGGICTRGNSDLTLKGEVSISGCQSLNGMGGGVLAAGGSLTVNAPQNKPVSISSNRARRGGGLSFMAPVHLESSTLFILENTASENGGGIFGFSNLAEMNIGMDHRLIVKVILFLCACTCVRACCMLVYASLFPVSARYADSRLSLQYYSDGYFKPG